MGSKRFDRRPANRSIPIVTKRCSRLRAVIIPPGLSPRSSCPVTPITNGCCVRHWLASPKVAPRRRRVGPSDHQLGGLPMSIRDILVYADPSPASGERLDLAFRLAHRFGAYLIGVVPEDAAAVGDRFATMLRQEALQGGLAASWVTRRAQAADLVV